MSRNALGNNEMARADGAGLTAHIAWLQERRLAPAKRVPCYARWVQRFLRLRGARPRETWQDSPSVFAADLQNASYEEWQFQQAAAAVTLYCGQFRAGEHKGVSPGGDSPTAAGQPELTAQVERLLQVRHYSLRTQRSYLSWTRRLLEYVDPNVDRIPESADA